MNMILNTKRKKIKIQYQYDLNNDILYVGLFSKTAMTLSFLILVERKNLIDFSNLFWLCFWIFVEQLYTSDKDGYLLCGQVDLDPDHQLLPVVHPPQWSMLENEFTTFWMKIWQPYTNEVEQTNTQRIRKIISKDHNKFCNLHFPHPFYY